MIRQSPDDQTPITSRQQSPSPVIGHWSLVIVVFLSAGCQQVGKVGEFGRNVIDYFSGNTPLNAVKKMEDRYFADERRGGINKLAARDFGRREPYTERYRQIAQHDSDWLVRLTAIRALNRARDAQATPVFIKALSDPNESVRIEAAKALANIPDDNAVRPLLKAVNNPDENRDVRLHAADALRHYRTLEVGRTLTGHLGVRDFGVAWQARKSLVQLTGKDLRYDEGAWLEYLTGPERPLG